MSRAPSLAALGAEQRQLISRARQYLTGAAARGANVAVAPDCFLSGWAQGPGYERLRGIAGEASMSRRAVALAKDVFNVARQSGYHVDRADQPLPRGIDRLVVSWARPTDFPSGGGYVDRYFRAWSGKTPTTLWLVVGLGDVPPVDAPNVRVFRRAPGTPRVDAAALAGGAVRGELSGIRSFARQISAAVIAQLRAHAFKAVVMPYEAHPFQHAICQAIREQGIPAMTAGYLHSALPPLPTDLLYREGAPDVVLTHGEGQAAIMKNLLGWPAATIRTIPSLRYHADDAASMSGFVFLPYDFEAPEVIEAAFAAFVRGARPGLLPALTVRNHPMMTASPRHQALTARLEAVMKAHTGAFAPQAGEPLSVFVGATAAIVEALEHGVSVVQICSRPLTEAHTPAVWTELDVEQLDTHAFRYRLAARGRYIDLGRGQDLFERYMPPAIAG